MKINEAINNLKHGKCIPYKHETLTMAIKSLEAWGLVKKEIKFIQEAEIQVYGKANWNFSGKCLEIIDKHLAEAENDNKISHVVVTQAIY